MFDHSIGIFSAESDEVISLIARTQFDDSRARHLAAPDSVDGELHALTAATIDFKRYVEVRDLIDRQHVPVAVAAAWVGDRIGDNQAVSGVGHFDPKARSGPPLDADAITVLVSACQTGRRHTAYQVS